MSDAVEAEILRLVAARGTAGSICPTDVARAIASSAGGSSTGGSSAGASGAGAPGAGEQWRTRLTDVRRAAIRLALAGRIDILRKGRAVDAAQQIRGVIRLRLRPAADPSSELSSEPGSPS